MKLDDLRAAQVDERGTDSLQPLRPTFYEEAAAYLADLRERRDALAERVDDPFDSEEVRRLTDELETAEEVVEAVYERRVGKLVKRASLAAAGMPADEAGLTEEEGELFGDLVDRIEANREAVLETLDGGRSSATTPGAQSAPVEPDDASAPGAGTGPSADPGDASEPSEPSASKGQSPDADQPPEPDGGTAAAPPGTADEVEPTPEDDRVTVRVTASVGEIYGVDDRVYTLDAEDVVSLPAANAKPLLDRGAAHRID